MPGILGTIFVLTLVIYQPDFIGPVETVAGVLSFLIWLTVAAWPAYRRSGLLVSWGLLFAPLFGTALAYGFTADYALSPFVIVAFALLIVLGHAVIIGTAGFFLGVSLKSIITNKESRRSKPSA